MGLWARVGAWLSAQLPVFENPPGCLPLRCNTPLPPCSGARNPPPPSRLLQIVSKSGHHSIRRSRVPE